MAQKGKKHLYRPLPPALLSPPFSPSCVPVCCCCGCRRERWRKAGTGGKVPRCASCSVSRYADVAGLPVVPACGQKADRFGLCSCVPSLHRAAHPPRSWTASVAVENSAACTTGVVQSRTPAGQPPATVVHSSCICSSISSCIADGNAHHEADVQRGAEATAGAKARGIHILHYPPAVLPFGLRRPQKKETCGASFYQNYYSNAITYRRW